MPDEKKFDIDPQVSDDGLPAELKGKSAGEIWKLVEAEKAASAAKLAAAEEARKQAENLAREFALSSMEREEFKRAPAAENKIPDREEDPEGWIKFQIDQGIAARVAPLAKQYTEDRGTLLSGVVAATKARIAAQFPDWKDYEKEIDEFSKNFAPDVLARPGALEEAYYRVKGKMVSAKDAEARMREQASLDAAGRPIGAKETEEKPKMTEQQARIAANFGVEASYFDTLPASGTVDIDDYLLAKEQAKKAAEKAAKGAR